MIQLVYQQAQPILMDYQVDYHEYYMLQMLDAEIKLKAQKK